MTALVVVHKPDAIHLLSDGACLDQYGRVESLTSKVALVAASGAAVAARGPVGVPHLISSLFGIRDFDPDDEFVPAIQMHIEAFHGFWKNKIPYLDLVAVRWSHKQQKLEHWLAVNHTGYEFLGTQFRPYAMHLRDADQFVAPMPSGDALATVGWKCIPKARDFDPVEDGIRLVSAQRLTAFPLRPDDKDSPVVHGVGGFVQLTTVAKDSLTTRIIHRWPEDTIGKRIEPLSTKAAA